MVTFSAANTISTDPRVRAANAYEARLIYAASRLSAADFIALQASLVAAGLPDNSNDVLSLPKPWILVDGLTALIFEYISAFPININPIAAAPTAVAGLAVTGGATASSMSVSGGATVGGALNVSGTGTITGAATVTGALSVGSTVTITNGGLAIGAVGVPALGELLAQGRVQGTTLTLDSTLDHAVAPLGTVAEDLNGDIYHRTLGATTVHLTRPTHDTGWLRVNAPGGGPHASLGFEGVTPPTPALTPDIWAVGGLWSNTAGIGDQGGITRMVVWLRCDEFLVNPPAVGNELYFHVHDFVDAAAFAGVRVYHDPTTGQLSIVCASAAPLVPGAPGVVASELAVPIDVRVMAWIR